MNDELKDDLPSVPRSALRRSSFPSGHRAVDEARERIVVNVAAGEDDADPFDVRREFLEEHGGGGDRARRLDEYLHAEEDEAQRFDDLVLGDREDALGGLLA